MENSPMRSAPIAGARKTGLIIAAVLLAVFLIQSTAHAASAAMGVELADSAGEREQGLPQIVRCIAELNGQKLTDGIDPACSNAGSIRFLIGRDKPAADWTSALRALGHILRQPGLRRLRIRVVGHASCQESLRNDPELMQLSLKRAKRVRDLLVHAGDVDDDRIDVEGRGRTDPIEEDEAATRATSPLAARCGAGSLASTIGSQRVTLEIATPVGLAYGEAAYGQLASPLAGTDPAPAMNVDPVTQAAVGGARGPAAAATQVTRYFPQGLRPGSYYTIDLGRASALLAPRVRGADANGCGSYRSHWLKLDVLSNLDKMAGALSIRFRTVRVRSDPNRVEGARLFVDLRGDAGSASFATPAKAPAHWALRERLAIALRQTMLGGAVPSEIERVDPRSEGPADFVAACRLPVAARQAEQDEEKNAELSAQQAFDAVIAAAPATAEDILGRALELNSLGFIRLTAGLQLCVRSAQTATRAAPIRFELGFGASDCAVLRKFVFDSGREGLTAVDPDVWRYRDPGTATQIPFVRKPVDVQDPDDHGTGSPERSPEQIVAIRWADLVDVSQSGPAYMVKATGPKAYWVGAPWATNSENADFIVGVRAKLPLSMNAGPLILNQFYRKMRQGCRRSGETFELPDGAGDRAPGTYLRWKRLGKTELQSLGYTTAARCATAERIAELSLDLPVRVGMQTMYLPVGASWGELASETVAGDRALNRSAAQSLAARLLFGSDAPTALLTASALSRLPLLPGDVARW